MPATLTDVKIITKMNWYAFLVACVTAGVGQLIPIVLSVVYPSLMIYGQLLGVVFTIAGIFQGLKIQTTDLSKAIAVSGGGESRGVGTAVPHEPQCAVFEKKNQALGKSHYNLPKQIAEQCSCSCHKI